MIRRLINCLPRQSTSKDLEKVKPLSLEDLYKDAPRGNMTPDEIYQAFDYEDDKRWMWKK